MSRPQAIVHEWMIVHEWNGHLEILSRPQAIVHEWMIVHEWNGHLEILSRPQAIENSRQYFLLRTGSLQKPVFGYPRE